MEKFEKIDLRKASNDAIYAIRKMVIRLKEKGFTAIQIEEITGYHHDRVSLLWCEYKKTGVVRKPKVHGRKVGEKKLLSPEQEQEIKKLVTDKNPNQLKFNCFLWDLRAVRQLIEQRYGIKPGKQTICEYLESWGMSSQRPAKQAYKQCETTVEDFKRRVFPAIVSRAKAENAEIYFADETGVNNQAYNPRGYAPIGQTPVVKVEVSRKRANMLAAISMSGHKKWLVYEEKTTQQQLISFMENMILDQQLKHRKKVFLFLDNLKVHHGKLVKEFLEVNKDKIEVFYFPSYSPELNPEELLNNVLKQDMQSGVPPRTTEGIIKKITNFMQCIASDLIQNLFHHPKLAYVKILDF
jgi:transposase